MCGVYGTGSASFFDGFDTLPDNGVELLLDVIVLRIGDAMGFFGEFNHLRLIGQCFIQFKRPRDILDKPCKVAFEAVLGMFGANGAIGTDKLGVEPCSE